MAADAGIIQVAAENRADIIIMGSHGRTGLKRLLMGSVTERVIGGRLPGPGGQEKLVFHFQF